MPEATSPTQSRSFRRHFQNWVSWAGMVLAGLLLGILSILVVDRQTMQERGDFSLFQDIRDEGIAV